MNGNWKLNAFAEEKWNCVPGVTVKWLHCTTTEFSFFHFSNKNIPNLNWKENGNFAYAWVNETFIFRISYPLFYSLFLNSFFSTTFFRFKKCFSLWYKNAGLLRTTYLFFFAKFRSTDVGRTHSKWCITYFCACFLWPAGFCYFVAHFTQCLSRLNITNTATWLA